MDKRYAFTQKVAQKLRFLRKKAGFSQQEIADKLFMAQTTYSKYERGCLVMNGTLAKYIADFYGVSVSYLLDDDKSDILISIDQFKKLIQARDVINEIEKSTKNPSGNEESRSYAEPKTRWKINTKLK